MARHKKFDRSLVLMKAMETFWRYGYEGTSIQDLVENMGINRGSLYDTFGDKRSLFIEAIAHYESTMVQRALDKLQAPDASKAAIVEYIYDLIDRAVSDRDRKGCLLTNTAVELASRDRDTAIRIAANLENIENAFKTALLRAKEKGEISQKHDIASLARFFICNLQGLRVISKVNPDPEVLRDIAKIALSVLD